MSVQVERGARRGLCRAAFVVLAVTGLIAAGAESAEARPKKKRPAYSPPFASIVVDANSGAVLEATHADALRHPASLAKVMTLYLLFERLDSGRLRLDTPLPVSAKAAAQPPTKIGLRPGQSIAVEDAIKALVTRSANDVAVVVAEAIAGSEAAFARMMTQRARSLGMRRTVYTNASGLPDAAQVTTAREQALLGRAIQERFPRYYAYFETEAFSFAGRTFRTHNRLLGYDGVDGIKTGYTRASGFNLLTSMRRGERHVVAVVLGGRSAATRDAHMRKLLGAHIMTASVRRTAPPVALAQLEPTQPVPIPPRRLEPPAVAVAAEAAGPAPVARAGQPEPGSTDPIKPLIVRTVAIRPADAAERPTTTASATAQPAARAMLARAVTAPPLPPVRASAAAEAPAAARAATRVQTGWVIQVGAFADEEEARKRLDAARARAKTILGRANPFTEPVERGERTLYRARFAGLDKSAAEAACRALKRRDIACLILKQ